MNRVAIYARVSTDEQDPQLQLDELRNIAAARGWHIVDEYVDRGVSGAKDSRPELDRMLAKVRRGGVDIVACWKFDRFARSTRHLVTALDEFRDLGVDFFSARDNIDTSTAAGRLMFQMIAAFAEFERSVICERTKAGVAAARKRGHMPGRPCKVAGDTRTAALDVAREMRAGKVSYGRIVATLQERHLGTWTRGAIEAALRVA